MEILQCLCYLIDDVFVVHLFEYALSNDVMQVRLHILEHEVDVLSIFGFNSFFQPNNVVVVKLLENADFPSNLSILL